MEPTVRYRRQLLAGAVLVAPVALAAGNSLLPKHSFQFAGTTEKATETLAATAASPGRVLAGGLALIIGMALLAVAFSAVASLVRHRGGAVATAGAVVGVIGALGGVLVTAWLALSVYAASQTNISDGAKARYVVSLLKGTHLGDIVGFPFFGGLFVGSVLLAIGLFRSGAVPRWLSVLFPVGVIFSTIFAPQGPPALLMGLPLIVAGVLLARRLTAAGPLTSATTSASPSFADATQ